MEKEITPVVTTNGMAPSEKEVVTGSQQKPAQDMSSAANAWAASGVAAAEEEEKRAENEADAGITEGTSSAQAEEAEDKEQELEEGDEEMGEAEYLEDDDCDDERELTEVDEEAEPKSNKGENTRKTPTATEEGTAADVSQSADDDTENLEEVDSDAEEGDEEAEEADDEAVEELVEEAEDEGEIITGDDAQEQTAEQAIASRRAGAQEVEQVDENQCRVCTAKEQLVSLFTKTTDGSTPADLLMLICPSVSIALKDFMPQFICQSCLDSLTAAIKLRHQLETTERDLRKRLSRSKNKVRRPRGYVVIDAPVSDSASEEDEEELKSDAEFKVSDVAGSTSPDSDSADSDISEKRKPGRRRGRKKGKRSAGANSQDDEPHRKRSMQSSPATSQGPFECDQCDLSFPRKQSYIMHRKMHDARHEFHCQICNKKFKVRGAYKTHMERHAAERAQFRCELCAQVFRLRAELKRHMALSHDEHGIIYECKRCQRTFLTQTRLQRHQSTSCNRHSETKVKRQSMEGHPSQGRDLFKSVAPLTTTYWSDSFSD